MRIYRKKDFDPHEFWDIFMPGLREGETAEDMMKKREDLLKESGVRPIAQTEKKLRCGDTIDIDGEMFHLCMSGINLCVVEEVGCFDGMPDEREDDDELHCPYCGWKIQGTFEFPDSGDHRCEHCGSLFSFDREIAVHWNSYPSESAVIKKI